jgi:hypothetical protein
MAQEVKLVPTGVLEVRIRNKSCSPGRVASDLRCKVYPYF